MYAGHTTLLIGDIYSSFLEPKMGHLTANNGSFPQQRTTRVGVVSSKIAKIYGVHAGVSSYGALFILRGGYKKINAF